MIIYLVQCHLYLASKDSPFQNKFMSITTLWWNSLKLCWRKLLVLIWCLLFMFGIWVSLLIRKCLIILFCSLNCWEIAMGIWERRFSSLALLRRKDLILLRTSIFNKYSICLLSVTVCLDITFLTVSLPRNSKMLTYPWLNWC